MSKFTWAMAAALAVSLGTTAAVGAEPGPYVAGNLGLAFPSDIENSVFDPFYGDVDAELSFSSAPILSAAAGYAFGNGVRVELEIGRTWLEPDELELHTDLGSDSGKVEDLEAPVTLLTIAGYYDFQTNSGFSPYVGGGAGLAITDGDKGSVAGVTFEADDSEDLAVLGEAGVSIVATDNLAIVPAYRFLWVDSGSNGWDDITAHIFKVGLRYAF